MNEQQRAAIKHVWTSPDRVAFNVWNIYQSSEERRIEHSKPVHRDQSEIVINVGSTAERLPQAGEVEFFLKQENGKLYRVIAEKTARDRFVNETLKYLQEARCQGIGRKDHKKRCSCQRRQIA